MDKLLKVSVDKGYPSEDVKDQSDEDSFEIYKT